MKLNLIDIDDFIKTRSIKEITSTQHFTGGGRDKLEPKGLFSEEIFGRLGDRKRKVAFGYINLKTKFIHPEAFSIFAAISPDMGKLLSGKVPYILEEDGTIKEDPSGETGIFFIVKHFDKLNFDKMVKAGREDRVEFVKNNKDIILIDKYLVMPAGIRDIKLTQKNNKAMYQYSEITDLYTRLLRQTNSIIGDISLLPSEIVSPMVDSIQATLRDINIWIKNRMKGKQGLIRSGMLKKVVDYSARMIITPDPTLKLGYVGVPWHIVLKLYEPYTIHNLLTKNREMLPNVQKYIDAESMDINEIRRFISNVNNDPYSVSEEFKESLITLAKDATKDKVLVYKRDPAENRDSWQASYIRVDGTGFVMKVKSFDVSRIY
jgi:DNA-directed RNA polymerase beta' subunit